MLFPCTQRIYAARAAEERATRAAAAAAGPDDAAEQGKRSAFFLKQHAEFGNACGTIAAVHTLSNAQDHFVADLDRARAGAAAATTTAPVEPLATFCAAHRNASADERGRALLRTDALKMVSDGAAVNHAAQTACPARDGPALDHHYAAFTLARPAAGGPGRVIELDGTKWAPIDHGEVVDDSLFLERVAAVVQDRFMAIEPDSIEFSLMALSRAGADGDVS